LYAGIYSAEIASVAVNRGSGCRRLSQGRAIVGFNCNYTGGEINFDYEMKLSMAPHLSCVFELQLLSVVSDWFGVTTWL